MARVREGEDTVAVEMAKWAARPGPGTARHGTVRAWPVWPV